MDPAVETEIIEETEDNLEVQEDVNLEVDTEDMPDSSGNQPDEGPGFVKKTMQRLGLISDEGTEDAEEEEGEEIPEAFTSAALELGWTEDDIVEFAKDLEDKDLLEMIPTLHPQPDKEQDDDPATEKGTPTPPENEEEVDESEKNSLKDEIRDAIRKEFQQELDSLKERLGEVDKETESRKEANLLSVVNTAFDEAADEFEIFGKTDELLTFPAGPNKGQIVPTSPQMKARSEVFERANAFIAMGADAKSAMQDALTWYKGKHLEQDVHRKLIRDLKDKETKLSAKRSGKETLPTYEDEEERQVEFIRQQAAKLGIKLAEE